MQQINLLSALPVRPRYDLTATMMAQIVGFFLLTLCALSIYEGVLVASLSRESVHVQSRLTTANDRLQKVMARYPQIVKQKEIAAEMNAMEHQLAEKKSLLDSLTRVNVGFSPYLYALSKAIVPDVWLTEIDIIKSSDKIQLTGKALAPTPIMQFLTNLDQHPAFAGKEFKAFEFSGAKEKVVGQINFMLSTGNQSIAVNPATEAK